MTSYNCFSCIWRDGNKIWILTSVAWLIAAHKFSLRLASLKFYSFPQQMFSMSRISDFLGSPGHFWDSKALRRRSLLGLQLSLWNPGLSLWYPGQLHSVCHQNRHHEDSVKVCFQWSSSHTPLGHGGSNFWMSRWLSIEQWLLGNQFPEGPSLAGVQRTMLSNKNFTFWHCWPCYAWVFLIPVMPSKHLFSCTCTNT